MLSESSENGAALASAPAAPRAGMLVDLESPSAEAFRALRLAVELRPQASAANCVLFTSPAPGDGKSLVSSNYALMAAQSAGRVLVMDADLRRGTMHSIFGVGRAPGLSEALRQDLDIASVAQRSPVADGIDIVPAGTPLARSGDLLESPKLDAVLREASESYDLVVVDSPPVLGLADAATIASHPSVEVIVVVDRNGKRRQLQRTLRTLRYIQATVLGLVVNRVSTPDSYYYYEHRE